jgi:hypothetical protein
MVKHRSAVRRRAFCRKARFMIKLGFSAEDLVNGDW